CERVEREAKPLPKIKRKVLWVIWDSPLMVAGAGSLADGLLQRVGVENIAGNVKIAYFKSSYDWLLEHQPDAIVWTASKRDNLKEHRFWGNLKAVKQGKVVMLPNNDLVQRPGPRITEGYKLLAEQLRKP
ncbi:MAG: ABC transporter substrate-binding protein, partial [Victivallales bacterium]|nr:ABC transporter substrate-binding protein [Victivallales bacterium]